MLRLTQQIDPQRMVEFRQAIVADVRHELFLDFGVQGVVDIEFGVGCAEHLSIEFLEALEAPGTKEVDLAIELQ